MIIDPKYIIGHWMLNGRTEDYGPRGLDLIAPDDVAWVTAPWGNTCIQTPTASMAVPVDIGQRDEYTVCQWMTPPDNNTGNYLAFPNPSAWVATNKSFFVACSGSLHQLTFRGNKPDGSGAVYFILSSEQIQIDQWIFVACSVRKLDDEHWRVLLVAGDEMEESELNISVGPFTSWRVAGGRAGSRNLHYNHLWLDKALSYEELQRIRFAPKPKPRRTVLYFPSRPVITDGLVGAWGFGNTPLKDASGNGHDGEIVGDVKVGKHMVSADGSGYISLPNFDGIYHDKDYTFGCWLYPTDISAEPTQVAMAIPKGISETVDLRNCIFVKSSGAIGAGGYRLDGISDWQAKHKTPDGVQDHWHFVAMRHYANGTFDVYANGEWCSLTSTTYCVSTGFLLTGRSLVQTMFRGSVKNAWVILRALSNAEVELIYRTTIPDDSLVLNWQGRDYSRFQASSVWYGDVCRGRRFVGNGTDAYVSIPDADHLRISDEITVQFWFKTQSAGMSYYGNGVQKYDANGGFFLIGAYNSIPAFYLRKSGSEYTAITAPEAIDADAWHLITGTGKAGGKIKLFVNGRKVAEDDLKHTFENANAPLEIGRYLTSYGLCEITDIKICAEEKSEAWVQNYYKATRAGF